MWVSVDEGPMNARLISPLVALLACGGGGVDPTLDGGIDGASDGAGAFTCPGAAEPAPRLTLTPVTRARPATASTFEGFAVRSSIPANAVGLVYVFHGTGGGVGFADQLATIEVTNQLEALGYGWLATESTERAAPRQWDPSLVPDNPDLARLGRLHADLIARAVIAADTPVFALGMSNGAVFTGTFAHWANGAGLPLRAAAMFEGAWRPAVFADGAPRVPTLHVRAENDSTADNVTIVEQTGAASAAGRPLIAHLAREVALTAARFRRIPGVDAAEAAAIFDELIRRGVIDVDGRRLVTIVDALTRLADVSVAGVTAAQLADAQNELRATWAEHQMRGDYTPQLAALFECAR